MGECIDPGFGELRGRIAKFDIQLIATSVGGHTWSGQLPAEITVNVHFIDLFDLASIADFCVLSSRKSVESAERALYDRAKSAFRPRIEISQVSPGNSVCECGQTITDAGGLVAGVFLGADLATKVDGQLLGPYQ